ncbi:MAG: hypothetical protein LBL73_03010, partial [Synergistaceae bacterium]|nr:hypothetical protein [Synergistaceae bacterium]
KTKYLKEGEAGLIHGNRGRKPGNAIPEELRRTDPGHNGPFSLPPPFRLSDCRPPENYTRILYTDSVVSPQLHRFLSFALSRSLCIFP